ncbi:MAG TPA: hypothetical protein PLR50_04550 [Candidatus Rifleibacterium sp.]|nr:hypothetical protein [Candidatus Rifleibacterium sp.]HPW57662.1 hypothetical protein [Candidatus Rifleibacterium sp.]HQB82743.1 hypothetical protein [Candidatus Rifleibacterium sp.]
MEIHQIIPIIVTLGLAWSGFLVGVIRWLQSKNEEALSRRLDAIEKSIAEIRADWAGMPRSYVLKDDCRRQEDQVLSALAMINRKLDELAKEVKK